MGVRVDQGPDLPLHIGMGYNKEPVGLGQVGWTHMIHSNSNIASYNTHENKPLKRII